MQHVVVSPNFSAFFSVFNRQLKQEKYCIIFAMDLLRQYFNIYNKIR